MADDNDKPILTRRRVLGGMTTIGVAGVLGSGTGAFFSDDEGAPGNTLTAGKLNLKLSWNKSYHGSVEESYTDQSGDSGPIFDLGDVKPGDWGEATINLQLEGNPATVSLTGTKVSSSENGRHDPEIEVDDDGQGELAQKVMAQMWYDANGDNDLDPGSGDPQGSELEVALVSDTSGSMSGSKLGDLQTASKSFVDQLASPDEGAAVSFASGSSVDQGLTTNYSSIKTAIDNYSAGGTTNMEAGINSGQSELSGGTSGADKVMILLSDGSPDNNSAASSAASSAKSAGTRIITIAFGSNADTTFLEGIASSSGDAYTATGADLSSVYSSIATDIGTGGGGEELFASGTLNEVLSALDGSALEGDQSNGCYSSGDNYIGFEWWLPEDVGNEVQTDSVEFDLEFNAEQCRHNPANRSNHSAVPSGRGNGTGNNSTGNGS